MAEKTYTYVGIATMKTRTKIKYANGNIEARIKGMQRMGFTNIEFVGLPGPMTKEAARQSAVTLEMAQRHNFEMAQAEKEAAGQD